VQRRDVIIIGGGPAGSSCAWRLRRAGLDVVVWDRAAFPRDKVCAGWITPQAVDDLELDLDEYGSGRTLQPITGFRVGVMGRAPLRFISYDRVVSYGIRRCEFDDYLLRRSGAWLELGAPVSSLRREHGNWIVNDRVAAPVLVGAGGHWCPVAHMLNSTPEREASAERQTRSASGAVVVAQETEFPIAPARARAFTTAADTPELYFTSDFKGYGWVFRKQGHVNIGVGSLAPHACPTATVAFVDELRARGVVPPGTLEASRWRGHAYRLSQPGRRRASGDGVLLAGDAIGLAYPQSGEGIRPAIESGLLAASTIIDARADYSAERLAAYDRRLASRFGDGVASDDWPSRLVSERTARWLGARLLTIPWFVRHIVLDRWFLRTGEPALTI
jgi:menaquinone-9 beta-reductase